jgi:histidyl-tRNA synthetase
MIQRPRGTRDFAPQEMEGRRFLEGLMRKEAELHGFREVMTPIFEHAELFTIKSGPNIIDEMYVFEDKGGRQIALRPELTAAVMRFFVSDLTNLPRPLKLYYFGQCFRYERPQSGRFREFFQFGAELIGTPNPESDAEIIALAASVVRACGLQNHAIRIGHIGVLRQKLYDAGLMPQTAAPVLQKLDKKLFDEARSLMEAAGVKAAAIDEIFAIVSTTGSAEVLQRFPGEATTYLEEVLRLLTAMGFGNVQVDLGVVRGLDYYTGIVFEMDAPNLGAEKQICGGGSYSLSELFGGEKVFSTGFGIGFDRVLLALEKEGFKAPERKVQAYVVPVTDTMRVKAFSVVALLRNAGIVADIDTMRRSLGKNMKYADAIGAKHVVIVGEKEAAQEAVTVRNLATGEQKLVMLNELPSSLKA